MRASTVGSDRADIGDVCQVSSRTEENRDAVCHLKAHPEPRSARLREEVPQALATSFSSTPQRKTYASSQSRPGKQPLLDAKGSSDARRGMLGSRPFCTVRAGSSNDWN